MIIVGLGKADHDCSICVSLHGKLKYSKYERDINKKHAIAPEYWFYQKLSEWKINPSEVELFVQTDSTYVTQNDSNGFKYPLEGEIFLKRKSINEIILDHHLAHAWSNTNYKKGGSFVVADGVGSGMHTSFLHNGETNYLYRSKELTPSSLYHELAYTMKIFDHTSDCSGKIMGLASYGKIDNNLLDRFKNEDIKEALSFIYNCRNYDFKSQEWFDIVRTVDEYAYFLLRKRFENSAQSLVYAGGCALNVVWNRRLSSEFNLDIQPHVYDGGLSLGCVRFAHDYLDIPQPEVNNFPYIQDDEFGKKPSSSVIKEIAEYLAQGKIVGWYQGHGEIGPRALGNRSILMNPTIKNAKDILNTKVKKREWWRPYGASIMEEDKDYFDIEYSPYMLYAARVLNDSIPAVTHIDGSCRHQTVNSKQNPTFYELLYEFKKLTGIPLLLNTSLNGHAKPIVSKKKNILDIKGLDVICMDNNIIKK